MGGVAEAETVSCIEPRTHLVWYAPTARRHFLSKRAACVGEARARIRVKHPDIDGEWEDGYQMSPGWSWRELPRAEVLLKRYARVLAKSLKKP